MGPSPSRNRVAGVPLGQAFCTSRRVASGIGSSPWGFSDIKHLLSADFVAFSFPYSSRPSLSCLVVRTKFPNRVMYGATSPIGSLPGRKSSVSRGVAATFMALGRGRASPGIPPPHPGRDESRDYAHPYAVLFGETA